MSNECQHYLCELQTNDLKHTHVHTHTYSYVHVYKVQVCMNVFISIDLQNIKCQTKTTNEHASMYMYVLCMIQVAVYSSWATLWLQSSLSPFLCLFILEDLCSAEFNNIGNWRTYWSKIIMNFHMILPFYIQLPYWICYRIRQIDDVRHTLHLD